MAWYLARPEYLKRVFERSRLYLYHIVEEIEKRGLPTELALLPMVESSFNPMAYSRAHASGLWQFIPGTGKRYELAQNWWYDGRRDIVDSTSAALDYLKDVYEMHGDWHLALASYNWGENAVARALEKNRREGKPLDYASLTMPLETRQYVPKLQALKNIIANPALFGIQLDPIPNEIFFTTVTRTRDMDVRLAAKLAEMPVEEFIALNPGFSRPMIRAELTPRIVLPADRVEIFHENLTKYDDKSLVSWKTYQPVRGDSLERIARKFGLGLAQLKEVNGIAPRSRVMPATLVVPTGGAHDLGRLPIMYAPPIPVAGPRKVLYTVKAGDTLPSIARRYRVSAEDLRRWNKIGRLAAGQKLIIQTKAPLARGKHPKGKTKQASPRRVLRKTAS
jgi:membrane-bound lytic murein transglycosylase D